MITTKILAKLIKLISAPEVSPNYLELVPELMLVRMLKSVLC